MTTNILNVAVVGCGKFGSKWIDILKGPNSRVVALCDSNAFILKSAGATIPNVSLYEDYHDLVTNTSVDAVYIATPPQTHYEITKACLLSGKHVLVEKPMTKDSRLAYELFTLAQKQDCILMVGHTYFYNRAIETILRSLDSMEIGTPRFISFSMTNPVDIWSGKTLDSYEHIVWDLGPHVISTICGLARSKPVAIAATAGASIMHHTPDKRILDMIQLVLEFPGGLKATCDLKWFDYAMNRKITVFGDNGVIACENPSGRQDAVVQKRIFRLERFRLIDESNTSERIYVGDTLERERDHFISCVKDKLSPITDGAQGAEVVRILEAAIVSQDAGGKRIDL